MAIYEDGTRDCPRCIETERQPPQRVRGDHLTLCPTCEHAVRNEVSAGVAMMEPFLRQHLRFTDYLIEHGVDPLGRAA